MLNVDLRLVEPDVSPAAFKWFWLAQATVSFSGRVTRQALPILAILALGAGPPELGVLQAVLTAPAVIMGLAAGRLVDRVGRVHAARFGLVARSLLLGLIPCSYAAGVLEWRGFIAIVSLYGCVAAVSDIAERSLLPEIVPPRQLVVANARLASTDAAAEVLGPLVMGGLIALLTPVYSLIADVIGLLFAFLFISRVRIARTVLEDVGSEPRVPGWRALQTNLEAAALVAALALSTLGSEAMRAVYTLHAITIVGLTPFELGVTFASGGLGLLTGATWVRRRPTLQSPLVSAAALFVNACGLALFPLASLPNRGGIAWLIVGQFVSDLGLITFLILARSRLQAITAVEASVDVFAAIAVSGGIMVAVGAVGAGALAAAYGPGIALCLPPVFKLLGCLLLVGLASSRKR